jgi:hypothetical protein
MTAPGRALREIPTVRRADVGRRVRHGAGYEAAAREPSEYFAVLAFDDLEGLRMYLEHAAHRDLGARVDARALVSGPPTCFQVTAPALVAKPGRKLLS